MAILTFISVGIYNAITGAFRLREELGNDGEFYTGIRLAMGLMNRDIMAAYSPSILVSYSKLYPDSQAPAPAAPGAHGSKSYSAPTPASSPDFSSLPEAVVNQLVLTSDFWEPALDKTGLRPSRFKGDDKKISFVSNSYSRIYRDSPESIFSKISFEAKEDRDPPVEGFKAENSLVLVKGESTDAFSMDDDHNKSFRHEYSLLRGITTFHFAFYKWKDGVFNKFNRWDSDSEDFKYQLPDVIEVELEVKGPTQLSFNGSYRFKPEIPLRGIYPSF